jgi:hypothetical protein
MRDEGKSPATIYARVSFLSSFYRWAMSHHQTRRTSARIVSEMMGSIADTQHALDHKNPTTMVYIQRIGIKRDRYSSGVPDRWAHKGKVDEG